MSFWNKLGQIALQAAPYVAAPFTGGMSLMAAPMTGKLANKLEDKSDQKEFEKTGIAPTRSMMNKIMGGVNMAAGMYGGAKLGGKIGGVGNDLPSQGGITGNMNRGGLGDFAKSFMNNQLSEGNGGVFNGMFGQQQQPLPSQPTVPASIALPNTGGRELPTTSNVSSAILRGRRMVNPRIGPS